MSTIETVVVPIGTVIGDLLPGNWFAPIGDALSLIAMDAAECRTVWDRTGFYSRHRLHILRPVSLDFPLVPGLTIELGQVGALPSFVVDLRTTPYVEATIHSLALTLWLPPTILKAYRRDPEHEEQWLAVDADATGSETVDAEDETAALRGFPLLCRATFRATLQGEVEILPPGGADRLAPAIPFAGMIADTGVILEFEGVDSEAVSFVFSEVPVDLVDRVPYDFRGLWLPHLTIHYFKPGSQTRLPSITVKNAAIGRGGFSGQLRGGDPLAPEELIELLEGWEEATEDDSHGADLQTIIDRHEGSLYRIQLEGFQAILYYLSITFEQSLPTASSLKGYAFVPFVDKWMAFDLSLGGPNGDLMLQLGGVGDEALVSLDNDWLEIKADALSYFTKEGVHYAAVSGSVRPKLLADEGFDWPEFKVERLLVSSEGDIELDGQWIDVPETITLDFHGFTIDISQVGFGTEGEDAEKRRWMGLSGGISLVKGLPLSASVDGLKFTRNADGTIDVALSGIGVELEIPETLLLKGMVSYQKIRLPEDPTNQLHGLSGHVFMGAVKLNIIPAKFEIDGQLLIGQMKTADGQPFTALYIMLDADLPAPIPLAATNTALYSVAFLIGKFVAPDRKLVGGEPERWYEWYKENRGPIIRLEENADEDGAADDDGAGTGESTDDDSSSAEPEGSAYSVTAVQKWRPEQGHIAMGFGVTIGTYFDDGYSLNVKAMLAILIPGPVVIIEGKADILKNRGGDDEQNRGAFYSLAVFDGNAGTFQLNVDVQIDLIDVIAIEGGLEAFFDFNDISRFYFHLGQRTPESKRIQAKILALFNANTYFMVDARSLQTGAGVGLDIEEEFGPVSFTLIAKAALELGVWWTRPAQFEGLMAFYGEVAIRIFGIGLGLLIELLAHLKTATPFWLHGRARLALTLPWPLPDIDLAVDVTWEDREAPRPVPFLKGARMMHHKLASAGWDLIQGPATLSSAPANAPVVPVDAQALLAFARPIHGYSQARNEAGQLVPAAAEKIDDWEFTYRLGSRLGSSVSLQKKISMRWVPVYALDPSDLPPVPGDPIVQPLHIDAGSVITAPDAQEPLLQLWGNTPIDAMPLRWRETIGDVHPPCRTQVRARPHCVDWQRVASGYRYAAEFTHRGLRFVADVLPEQRAQVQSGVLRSPAMTIRFPEAIAWLEITIQHWQGAAIRLEGYLRGRRVVGPMDSNLGAGLVYIFKWFSPSGSDVRVDAVRLSTRSQTQAPVPLVSICYKTYRDVVIEGETAPEGTMQADAFDMLGSLVLDPHSEYRLEVRTVTEITEGGEAQSVDEPPPLFYYFRTGGGPATNYASLPAGATADFDGGPLDDLRTYVGRTIPADGAKRHYYAYDLAVEFNEGYVRDMYLENERPAIRIRDRNGKAHGATEGTEIVGLLPLMPESLLTWLNAQSSGGCLPRYAGSPPFSSLLSRTAPQLKPNRMYVAEIMLHSGTDATEHATGFQFQFATSRYRDIEDHLRSAEKDGAVLIRDLPARPGRGLDLNWLPDWEVLSDNLGIARRQLSETIRAVRERDAWDQLPNVAEMLTQARAALAALDDFSGQKFRNCFSDPRLGLAYAAPPPVLEFNRLHFEADGQLIVLVESPEPLEWERMQATLILGESDARVRSLPPIIWSQDKTRALLFDQNGWMKPGHALRLEITYRGDLPDLPPLYRDENPISPTLSLRLKVGA